MKLFEETKIIWRYLRNYKKKVFRVTIFAVLGAVLAAMIPFLYGKLIDIAKIENSSFFLLFSLLAIWLLMSLISDWLSRLTEMMGAYIGIDASNDLITEGANHIIRLPLKFHKDKKMGEIISRIQRAADFLKRLINDVLFFSVPQFISVFVALIIVFLIEWRLALGLLAILSVYSFATVKKTIPIIKNQKKLNQIHEEIHGDLYDSVFNIQIIKSSTAEDYERKKLEKNFKKDASEAEKNNEKLWQSLNGWQKTIFGIGFVAIFGAAMLLLRSKTITVGELVMLIGYWSMISRPFGWLGNQYRIFRQGVTAIKRVNYLLAENPEEYHKENAVVLNNVKGEVKFENVSFGYNKNQAVLQGINLLVGAGEKVALVGESGVGKTTLVELLSRYYDPEGGKIFIDGVDISEIDLAFLRSIIAVVPQEITLFNDSVKNNIRYAKPDASDNDIIEAAKAANAHDFIDEFTEKYDTRVGERGIKLSTGQKQRIAIARAILRNPKILILDEATSSLDSQSEKIVQEALERLMEGRTTFIIAHRLSTIRSAKIRVLEEGKIVEEGSHEELLKKDGVYAKFYNLQFKEESSIPGRW